MADIVGKDTAGVDIVGTWKLVESRARNDAGVPTPPSYGPQGVGLVIFGRDGRMMCVLSDFRAELPVEEGPREYTSYTGYYTFDGTTLTTRVDGGTGNIPVGHDQVRQVRLEGDRLVLVPPPRPWRGATQHRELVWVRID